MFFVNRLSWCIVLHESGQIDDKQPQLFRTASRDHTSEYASELLHLIFLLRCYCIVKKKCVDRCKQHQKAVVCVTFFSPAVYLAVSLFFRVLSWTRNLFGCVSVCARLGFLCLHLALAWRGREDWSERRWLKSAGQWAHGPVASDCHHGPVLARLWHARAQSPVSTSHPPFFP